MWTRDMRGKKRTWRGLVVIAVFGLIFAGSLYAQGPASPFPTYGAGVIQVRLYTDYFCPPCRAMEPPVEPVLRNLLKRKVITLTLVDVPLHRYSPLYAQYFLYALMGKNDLEHALRVRNILFEAATNTHITTKEQLEEIFKSKGIPFAVFDPKPAFNRYNGLITEEGIKSTPTCVIIRGGKKETFTGSQDILKALKHLQ
ncbi:MAG: thioredoxin domain-containing protein [Deltaproteobacteria bacterium]|nr:thioredoxin domain-containing protein [Deltaproteobacteria bacterium]